MPASTGAVAIDRGDYVRLTGDRGRNEASVELAPGASAREMIGRAAPLLPAER